MDLKELGNILTQYHSGMDAVYAVGSFAISGKVHPSLETVRKARDMIAGYARKPDRSWSRKDVSDLKRAVVKLDSMIREKGGTLPLQKGRVHPGDIATMLDSYITTALWSTNDESDESGGRPLDDNYGPSDVSAGARAAMRRDVHSFATKYGHLILSATAHSGSGRWEKAGHDFWLTRNGHGAGFWDGDWKPKEVGDALTRAAKSYSGVDLYVGDDKKIHSSDEFWAGQERARKKLLKGPSAAKHESGGNPRLKGGGKTDIIFRKDGSVTVWDVHAQGRVTVRKPSDQLLASLNFRERERVIRHVNADRRIDLLAQLRHEGHRLSGPEWEDRIPKLVGVLKENLGATESEIRNAIGDVASPPWKTKGRSPWTKSGRRVLLKEDYEPDASLRGRIRALVSRKKK